MEHDLFGKPVPTLPDHAQLLMVRRRVSAVSNHEAELVASSFETRLCRSSG
jgi:hypothetical protein